MVSKLLQVLAVREIGSVLGNTKSKSLEIIINCLTPGACRSDFDRESVGIRKFIHNIMSYVIGRSTKLVAERLSLGSLLERNLMEVIWRTVVSRSEFICDKPPKTHVSFDLLPHANNVCFTSASPWVLSTEGQEVQKKFWSQLLQQLEAIQPGISKNV